MYDLKLTLHKHHFTQVYEFIEAFERVVIKLAYEKALCSVETYEDKAIIYVSTSQMNTNLFMRGVSSLDVERGNFDQYARADLATLTNYYSEEHTTELMLAKLKDKRRFIEGTVLTTHKIEITRELLKQFDWDSKTYDERQVLVERLLPSVTDTQQYSEIHVISGGCTRDIEDWDIASATIEELFGNDASDFW